MMNMNSPSIAEARLLSDSIKALAAGPNPIDADIHPVDVMQGRDARRSEDAVPATGNLPTRGMRVAAAAAEFATIRVSHDPQNIFVGTLDEARLTALEIRVKRISTSRRIPMPVMRMIAELGVGKTWAAEKLVERCSPTDPADMRRPVLLIELDTSGKQISLPRGILKELGKRGWHIGTEPELLWARAMDALKEFGVEIVIFDEINRAARRPSLGSVIGGDIMGMLLKGDVAVAFIGTSEAIQVFDRCKPLKDRMKATVVLKALDWIVPEDEKVFTDFLAKMDQAFVEKKLTDSPSGLDNVKIAKPLWDVCRGRLRPLCLLLEEAVLALHREDPGETASRVLGVHILAQAVEDLSIPEGVVNYNPFTEEMPA